MSMDAISQVTLAEKQAESIRRKADADAKAMVEDAYRRGQQKLADTEERVLAETRQQLNTLRAKAVVLMKRSHEEAEAQAEEQVKAASRNMGAAVKAIIGGLWG